jgi:hypothetical protein
MMLDAFLPEHVTELAVDSIFMAPQLGVLSTVHPRAAKEVFEKDCLVRLGSAVAPVGPGRDGVTALNVTLEMPGGKREEFSVPYGYIRLLPLALGETAKATLRPEKGLDVGEGKGRERVVTLKGGVVGLIFDARGRQPFKLPEDRVARIAKLNQWNEALGIYPPRDAAKVSVAELRPVEARA